MELMDYLASARKSLFRFEYLQSFDVLQEKDELAFWQRHKKLL